MALGRLHWKTRAHHKKVFPDKRTRFGHDRGANEALPCRIQGSVQGAEVLAIGRNDGGLPIHVVNRLLIYYPLVPTAA